MGEICMDRVVTDKNFDVNYHEIDYKKRALITSIMNYFEDVSMEQSEKFGVGFEYLKDKGLAWVLYKWHIKVKRYPTFGEKIISRTIPLSSRKFYAYRKFEIIDSEGNVIIEGNSVWLLIDTNKCRPVKVTKDMLDAYRLDEVKEEPFKIPKIKLPEEFSYRKEFDVRYSDIDTNLHVNNIKYVAWIIETIPLDIVLNYNLYELSISYEKEVKYGTKVNICTELIEENENNIVWVHKIENEEGKKSAVAKTYWHK